MQGVRSRPSGAKFGQDKGVSTTRDNTGTTTMEEFTFVCSECAQEIAVNGEMRDAILDNGCPVCAAAVTPAAFS